MIENADLMKEGQSVEIVVHADTETPLNRGPSSFCGT